MAYTDTVTLKNRPSFWTRVWRQFEIMGYARAAAELTRLGYHKEAKNCIMQVKRLRD